MFSIGFIAHHVYGVSTYLNLPGFLLYRFQLSWRKLIQKMSLDERNSTRVFFFTFLHSVCISLIYFRPFDFFRNKHTGQYLAWTFQGSSSFSHSATQSPQQKQTVQSDQPAVILGIFLDMNQLNLHDIMIHLFIRCINRYSESNIPPNVCSSQILVSIIYLNNYYWCHFPEKITFFFILPYVEDKNITTTTRSER